MQNSKKKMKNFVSAICLCLVLCASVNAGDEGGCQYFPKREFDLTKPKFKLLRIVDNITNNFFCCDLCDETCGAMVFIKAIKQCRLYSISVNKLKNTQIPFTYNSKATSGILQSRLQ